jgi:hypothetical protein
MGFSGVHSTDSVLHAPKFVADALTVRGIGPARPNRARCGTVAVQHRHGSTPQLDEPGACDQFASSMSRPSTRLIEERFRARPAQPVLALGPVVGSRTTMS